jgi:predicted AAA+ superfamily ATPase
VNEILSHNASSSWHSRWTGEQMRAMLIEQFNAFWQRDTGLERTRLDSVLKAANLPHGVIISGLRRVGKSTLLAQLAHRLGKESCYSLNFEDERFLGFNAEDANDLYQRLSELFGERKVFILDEVQNIPEWERFVRRFMDMGFKFYISGSNASLLSRELGTRLTGRYVPIELFPFTFIEYVRFLGHQIHDPKRWTTSERGAYQRLLIDYLRLGGLPEPLKYPELTLHQSLYNDVLYRDIAARYHIEEVRALKELAFYLMSNAASLVSYNKLKEHLRLGSVNTVKNYMEYMQNSWLLFILNVYDYSVRRQQIAPKKVYGIDTGLLNAVGFSFSPNTGRLMENLVFLALRQQFSDLYYYVSPTGHEVDFYLPKQRLLIQVSQDLHQQATYERVVRGLTEAMEALKIESGLILSETGLPTVQVEGHSIKIAGLLEWLTEGALR